MRNNDLLSGTRRSRAFTTAEAKDIWADILDDTSTLTHHHRQSSARSTPSKLDRPVFRPRPVSEALTESDLPSEPQWLRQDHISVKDQAPEAGKRVPSFGRTYQDNSFNGVRGSSLPAAGGERNRDKQRQGNRSSKTQLQRPQEALGGWWKMKWWTDGKGKDKDNAK